MGNLAGAVDKMTGGNRTPILRKIGRTDQTQYADPPILFLRPTPCVDDTLITKKL